MAPADRLDVLARRVRWFDRYRRALSIVIAIAVWVVVSRKLSAYFDVKWPNVLAGIVSALVAMLAWAFIEAGFAWVLALWETEHDRISRDRGLPRASLLRRRKR